MKTCTLLYTSDIHGYLFPTNYAADSARIMGLLTCSHLMGKDGNTLILDGGDTIQGSPFLDFLRNDIGRRFPVAAVMNELGYDCMTLGNHDFNYGYGGLEEFLGGCSAQCVCANVVDHAGRLPLVPYVVRKLESGLRIGIVGIVTDFVNVWEPAQNLEGLSVTDAFEAARKACRKLHGSIDVLVCIYHGGYEQDLASGRKLSDSNEDIACKLARELDFDILLTGHQHLHTDGTYIGGTFTVQPGAYASEVCKITVDVDDDGSVRPRAEWLRPDGTIRRPIPSLPALQSIERDIQRRLDEPLGRLPAPIVFSGRLDSALHGSPLAMLINQVQMEAGSADVSATCLYNVSWNLPREITARDLLITYEFPNTLKVLEVTGAILRLALERCASYFVCDSDGHAAIDAAFLQNERQHFNYDYFAGITYEVDISRPVGERVVALVFDGSPVRDEQVFRLALNSYRATGGGGFPWYADCRVLLDSQLEIPQLLRDYIRSHTPVASIPPSPYTVRGYR
ncbi:MAG: bifunctional metallophosphatase/5'-nucleotidase [Sphaerochaetaceae bacterium]|jgi:2',3'-cyclic-nucleotide 2'-phosphodiesterase/3'-nucleotidase